MLNLFGRSKNKGAFGLDLGDVSLKLVQFEKQGTGFRKLVFSDELLPKGVIVQNTIKDPKTLVQLIQNAVARPKFGHVSTTQVVASIPETKCFVRVISMSRVSEEEAVEAIPWESEAYIPIPRSQVYLDWVVLSEVDPAQKDKMKVLITAAPKDYVDEYTQILKEAGLKPMALEIESQAIARSLVSNPKETVLLLDIDTVRTSFIIYDQGTLEFTSSIPLAGTMFTDRIAKDLGVTAEEAEQLKRENGLDVALAKGRVKKSLTPLIQDLVSETKNILRFYEEHVNPTGKISRLMLSGGSSKLKHLPSVLKELLNKEDDGHVIRSLPSMRVELGNPWQKILGKKQVPPLSREESLSYSTAIGLALWDFEE